MVEDRREKMIANLSKNLGKYREDWKAIESAPRTEWWKSSLSWELRAPIAEAYESLQTFLRTLVDDEDDHR